MTDASFTTSGFAVGDSIKITCGLTASEDLIERCRRRFWYKPWTWFRQNYAFCKITRINGHAIDVEN